MKKFVVFNECQIQSFFVISELKFITVNEHFEIAKVTMILAFVKNAKFFNKIIFSKEVIYLQLYLL